VNQQSGDAERLGHFPLHTGGTLLMPNTTEVRTKTDDHQLVNIQPSLMPTWEVFGIRLIAEELVSKVFIAGDCNSATTESLSISAALAVSGK
jgi:hypothetical protein